LALLPHEVIAFGYVKLLQWKPTRVVAELSDTALDGLADRLEEEYFRFVPLPEVRDAFAPLRQNLSRHVPDCDADPRAKEPYASLADRVAGHTLLREYFPTTGTAEAAVTRWWAAVKRVVAEEVLRLPRGPLTEVVRERHRGRRQRRPEGGP
jgi:hypothetical protein